MRVVVDANVAVKWAVPEADSERAWPLLDAELIVPDLFFAEVANVLWKKARRGEISTAEADRAADTLLALDYEVASTVPLMRDAVAMACALDHLAYDFHYVVLAQRHGVRLVTADDRFVGKVRALHPAPVWLDLVTALSEI